MSGSVRVVGGLGPGEQRAASTPREAHAQDLLLARRAAQGEGRVQEKLALRFIGRVRRMAHALMAGAAEADDAAQLALIELLRSMRGYAGDGSLETFCDRLSARAIVRFARAVRARRGAEPQPSPGDDARPELASRSLEEFLRQLPDAPREVFLLREAVGLDLVQTARLTQLPIGQVRDHLARVRTSLAARGQKTSGHTAPGLSDNVQRWLSLRDQSTLSEEERTELGALESDAEVRKLQKELRGAQQSFERGAHVRASGRDKNLVPGVLSAVRVSSAAGRGHRAAFDAVEDAAIEPAEGTWVQTLAFSLCVALVLFAFAALYFREPSTAPMRQARPRAIPTASLQKAAEEVAPTIESLSIAKVTAQGTHLSRAGAALSEGAIIREGDVIAALERAGCFVVSPRVDVCLGPGSEARIVRLGLVGRRVALLRGRAVVSVEASGQAGPFAVLSGELLVSAEDADFAVEADPDQVSVRALRGKLSLHAGGRAGGLSPGRPPELQRTVERHPGAELQPAAELEPAVGLESAIELQPAVKLQPTVELEPALKLEPAVELEPTAELQPAVKLWPAPEPAQVPELRPAVELQSAQAATHRIADGALERMPTPADKARRDWDLLATRATTSRSTPQTRTPRAAQRALAAEVAPESSPRPAAGTAEGDDVPEALKSGADPTVWAPFAE